MTKKPKKKAKPPTPKPMSTKEYLATLDFLNLTRAGKKTAEHLGMSVRQCMRIASGEVPVPGPVAKLLKMYLKHDLPDE